MLLIGMHHVTLGKTKAFSVRVTHSKDSTLTGIMATSRGGNANTVHIAPVGPAS